MRDSPSCPPACHRSAASPPRMVPTSRAARHRRLPDGPARRSALAQLSPRSWSPAPRRGPAVDSAGFGDATRACSSARSDRSRPRARARTSRRARARQRGGRRARRRRPPARRDRHRDRAPRRRHPRVRPPLPRPRADRPADGARRGDHGGARAEPARSSSPTSGRWWAPSTEDRLAGILGKVGRKARTIPVDIRIATAAGTAPAADRAAGRDRDRSRVPSRARRDPAHDADARRRRRCSKRWTWRATRAATRTSRWRPPAADRLRSAAARAPLHRRSSATINAAIYVLSVVSFVLNNESEEVTIERPRGRRRPRARSRSRST